MKILVLNGPNLNLLGNREKKFYEYAKIFEIDVSFRALSATSNKLSGELCPSCFNIIIKCPVLERCLIVSQAEMVSGFQFYSLELGI